MRRVLKLPALSGLCHTLDFSICGTWSNEALNKDVDWFIKENLAAKEKIKEL